MKEIFVLGAIITLAISHSSIGEWHISKEGNLYFVEGELKYNWFQAVHECVRKNMSLIAVDTVSKYIEIYNIVQEIYQSSTVPRLWIGGHDNANRSHFAWISTGRNFEFVNWIAGEPNDSNNAERCVATWSNVLAWNDAPCSSELGFICEENQSVKKTNLEFVALKSELDNLKKSMEAKNLQELNECETEALELKEKQSELANKLNEKNEELTKLKELIDQQAKELKAKEEVLNKFKKVEGQGWSEEYYRTETIDSIESTTTSVARTLQDSHSQEELEHLQKSSELLMKQLFLKNLLKPNNNSDNQTTINKFYNFVVNFKQN